MKAAEIEPLTIAIDGTQSVSGMLLAPEGARACYVLAHGAGAGMTHPFMGAMAEEFAARDVATLRYQFPYMERRSRRPDPPAVAHAAVRAAVAEAARRLPGLPLIAGGKSFGGRMTSQAQAAATLTGVRGLVFLGFPLHPAGKPSVERGEHLAAIRVPMLFLQGTRDELAEAGLMQSVVQRLGAPASLEHVADAVHSFHVPARSGRTDAQVRAALADALVAWLERTH